MRKFFTGQEIIAAMNLLVQRLADLRLETDIYVVGGAAFLLRKIDRRITVDIDAKVTGAERVLEVSEQLAIENGWPSDWFNTSAKIFVPFETDYSRWELHLQQGAVRVFLAPFEDLLIMKLNAARPTRDDEDILFLLGELKLTTLEEIEEFYEGRVKGAVVPSKALKLLHNLGF